LASPARGAAVLRERSISLEMASEAEAKVAALRRTCLLQKVGSRAVEELAAKMVRVEFRAGEELGARQGEAQQSMFVVTSGSVRRVHASQKRRVQRVNEGPEGMGDVSLEEYKVSHEVDGGSAVLHVEGPDVDGLLSSMSRALFSAGVKISSAHATCPEGNGGETRAATVFRVERDEDEIDEARAAQLAQVVREACVGARLGSLRETGRVNSFGTLHCVGRRPAFATTVALTDGVAWRLEAADVEQALRDGGGFAVDVCAGLCAEIFRMSESYAPTPIFDQPPQRVNVAAVSVAAAFESYYRAMMNAVLNSSLSGSAGPTLFPNMHVQIPTRVAYINGFKFLRQGLDDLVEEKDPRFRWLPALLPGVLMTPVSSVLEASNAGHANPEPLLRRAARGTAPRCAREVLFGLGLNNLADFFEETVPKSVASTKLARNAIGSVAAGVIAGYFSHVPHNLSTLKMLHPHTSYAQHWTTLVQIARTTRLPPNLPPRSANLLANLLTLFLPAGLAIRTTQIVGSFCLLNGISHVLN